MPGLDFAYATMTEIAGRPTNEDCVLAGPRLVAVADGVGGEAAGEVASRLAVESLVSLEKRFLEGPLEQALRGAVLDGNEKIGFVASCRPQWAGMATTVSAAALSDEGEYVIANAGDSRTYLLRDGSLARLTRDDTFVQELLDLGQLSPDEARRHPQRSVVVNVLDGRPERKAAVTTVAAREGDRVLVCSDGLTDFVADERIAGVLAEPDRLECAEALVAEALLAGGVDNISVVVADVLAGERRVVDSWRGA